MFHDGKSWGHNCLLGFVVGEMVDTSTVRDAKYCCNTFNVIYTQTIKTLTKLNIMFHTVERVL